MVTKFGTRLATVALVVIFSTLMLAHDGVATELLAFPGAEGAGAYATGGRGGSVYHVTSLADNGDGTLRRGIENANGPTTIVFDVSGTIELQSKLVIRKPNITIAGQTAPGSGVTVSGNVFSVGSSESNHTQADNTIIRYMRFRNGQPAANQIDTFSITGGNNVIIDHVSASWGSDENLSVTKGSNYVTVQWSLITEGLDARGHGYGSLIAPENPGTRYTFHHNLYANNSGRIPRAGSRDYARDFLFDFRNNVAYNWGGAGDWGGWAVVGGDPNEERVDFNFINNYYVAGPNTPVTFYSQTALSSNYRTSRIFQSGNKIDSNHNGVLDGIDTGWDMIRGSYSQLSSPLAVDPMFAVVTETADEAYYSVLRGSGATFPVRDEVDQRVIAGVLDQSGRIIREAADVGGLPTFPFVMRPLDFDTDGDGMPGYWEMEHGLDPDDPDDRNDIGKGGYTNLEIYLNSLVAVPEPSTVHLMACVGLTISVFARCRR
ncbi:MAG: hypothetical protein R3C10_13580 [Pirellulales bacterium]